MAKPKKVERVPKVKKHSRRNIRKIIKNVDLSEMTKVAVKNEHERKKRLKIRDENVRNRFYLNDLFFPCVIHDFLCFQFKELLLGCEKKPELVLDIGENKDVLISVDQKLVQVLKPHQKEGIQFMWNACFESCQKIYTSTGGGCILAHCMGLGKSLCRKYCIWSHCLFFQSHLIRIGLFVGKSLQVIALTHTQFSHAMQTNVRKVLILCPKTTILNWINQFIQWLGKTGENVNINVFEISEYVLCCHLDFPLYKSFPYYLNLFILFTIKVSNRKKKDTSESRNGTMKTVS